LAADDGDVEGAKRVEGQHLAAQPTPPRRVRMPLATINDCRRAMAQVIREARAGRMTTTDMARFCYALRELAKVVEASELETRIEALEQRDRDEAIDPTPRAH
jgi:hypothetical protein